MTNPAPPAARAETIAADPLPTEPGLARASYPDAVAVPSQSRQQEVSIDSDAPQRKVGSLYSADGNVVVKYAGRTLKADHIDYDSDTGEVTMTGHLLVTGGENDERIQASHGTLNIQTQTGRFYDVTGSVGIKPVGTRLMYANGNPFLFSGRMVVKTGPQAYTIFDGTVTSCALPKPDWQLAAGRFDIDGEKARAKNSIFHLMRLPVLYLPYVTHPVDAAARQSGVLIPTVGFASASKGNTVGEQVYWSINRSTDLTLGTVYYSARGWSENGSFRYRGVGRDFALAHFTSLQDRGYTPPGGAYINQGGTEATFSGRRGLGDGVRGVVDVDYLSSFLYREGFTDNFNQAVSSDVVSTIYATREWDGIAASLEADRYQGEKRIQSTSPSGVVLPEEEVHIFHAPAMEISTVDRRLGRTRLEWTLESSATGLKRSEPKFATSGIVERLDVHPEVAFPFTLRGLHVRPSFAVRETFYSRSRIPGVVGAQTPPVESQATVNRTDEEVAVELRPPVVERTFTAGPIRRLLRHEVRHTIEPAATFRYVTGVNNFNQLLRFDAVDVASNTNEIEYGVTQRLFLRRTGDQPCRAAGTGAGSVADLGEVMGPAEGQAADAGDPGQPVIRRNEAPTPPVCGSREWISWRLAQKYFFDPTFGGAVQDGPRNIFDTTLAFTGVAFLTQARNVSPLLSRLRVRTSEKLDVEWDFDFDTGTKTFTSSNVFLDLHQGPVFGGIGYAKLDAPGRSYIAGTLSSVADFSQMRVLLGYGKPTNAGFSAAANAGLDLNLGTVQYGAVQTSYNWNCCGVSVEYRKYELGTARNENVYRFNFTLANIGTAGNLRRREQVF